MSNYIEINSKTNCCGCAACYSICPKSCITMRFDEEAFLYPQIDNTVCKNCGLCKRACPIENAVHESPFSQKAYIVQHTNPKILFESTSGGAFTGIANEIIKKEGVVFGAVLCEDLIVRHGYVETREKLSKFRNSKYVQSQIEDSLKQVANFLLQGRYVCFSGTPCQIEGLYSFLLARNIQQRRLITVDVVCHAVPSVSIYKKYLELFGDVKDTAPAFRLRFRDKSPYGYKYSQMSHYDNNGKMIYHKGIESDYMLRAFFSNICDRPACYECSFKKRYRPSDFTIWDCFNPRIFDRSFDNDKGVSFVLAHSQKAQELFSGISNFRIREVSPDVACADTKMMVHSVPMNPKREDFFADSRTMDATVFFEKYFPDTPRVKLERIGRKVCIRLGVYKPMLRLVQKIGVWGR